MTSILPFNFQITNKYNLCITVNWTLATSGRPHRIIVPHKGNRYICIKHSSKHVILFSSRWGGLRTKHVQMALKKVSPVSLLKQGFKSFYKLLNSPFKPYAPLHHLPHPCSFLELIWLWWLFRHQHHCPQLWLTSSSPKLMGCTLEWHPKCKQIVFQTLLAQDYIS